MVEAAGAEEVEEAAQPMSGPWGGSREEDVPDGTGEVEAVEVDVGNPAPDDVKKS